MDHAGPDFAWHFEGREFRTFMGWVVPYVAAHGRMPSPAEVEAHDPTGANIVRQDRQSGGRVLQHLAQTVRERLAG